jgi:hypothetical protein
MTQAHTTPASFLYTSNMNTLRRFFRTVIDSASKPASYKPHLKERTGTGLGYLYWLLVCLSTISALVLAAWYIPARAGIQEIIEKAAPVLRESFPPELVLTLQTGALSTNMEEPIFIDPEFWDVDMDPDDEEPMPDHFLTIDTNASIDDFSAYDTAILATRTHIVWKDDNQLRANAFSEFEENFVLDYETYEEGVTTIEPMLNNAPLFIDMVVVLLILCMPFIGAGFAWAWYLFMLLIWTCLLWVLAAVMQKKLTYGELYRLGLYGVTLPLLYSTIAGWIPVISWPLVPTLIYLVFMGVVLSKITTKAVPAAPQKSASTKKKASRGRKKAKQLA